MGATKITYEEAVRREDKAGIVAVNARRSNSIDQLSEFPNLTSLDLHGNRHITDFAFLAELPGLRKLFIGDMGLTAIPAEVASLEHLDTLSIGKNTINDFSLLATLGQLVDLGLEEMGLRKIPGDVLNISGLKVLGLYGNRLASIAGVKKLANLEQLYVANNNLTKIPKELTSLVRLRKLSMGQNHALADVSALQDLPVLAELNLSQCDIRSVPGSFSTLKALKILDLSCNIRLHDISVLERVSSLEELRCKDCDELPGEAIAQIEDAIASRATQAIDTGNDTELGAEEHAKPTDAPEPGGETRTYLEHVGGKSSKFWQVVVDGARHAVTYGKIGKSGTTKKKKFKDSDAATKDAERLIEAKLKKGYVQSDE